MSHVFNFTDFRKNLLNAYPCVEAILETKGDGQLQELFPIRHDAHVFKLLKDDLRIPYIDEVIQSVNGKIEIFHDLLNAIGALATGQDDLGTKIFHSTILELRDGFPDIVELPEFTHVRFVHCLKVKPRSLTVKVETVCGNFLRIFGYARAVYQGTCCPHLSGPGRLHCLLQQPVSSHLPKSYPPAQ